jgi:hypothetical protein
VPDTISINNAAAFTDPLRAPANGVEPLLVNTRRRKGQS